MENEYNGGKLKTYRGPCLKGTCDEIDEIEEIGYLSGAMHVRCINCGYEQQMPEAESEKELYKVVKQ